MNSDPTHEPIAYDRFFELCGKAFERHGDILDLPLGDHPYAYLKRRYVQDYPNGRVLDFGCGAQKPLQKELGIDDRSYSTCDSDPSGHFTYRMPQSIPAEERFDIISSSHTLEHLPFEDGLRAALELGKHLKPGGIFLIGVPNPKHPTRYLSSPVHVAPWNYLNLCAAMELAGLDPFYCARTHKHPRPSLLERPLINWLCRRFMMDWCDGIYVVGRRSRG